MTLLSDPSQYQPIREHWFKIPVDLFRSCRLLRLEGSRKDTSLPPLNVTLVPPRTSPKSYERVLELSWSLASPHSVSSQNNPIQPIASYSCAHSISSLCTHHHLFSRPPQLLSVVSICLSSFSRLYRMYIGHSPSRDVYVITLHPPFPTPNTLPVALSIACTIPPGSPTSLHPPP